ncbi:MAG TPA: adenosine deaminase [Aggregatilineales bacterium]|nr:adenosine deaminase [Aggregatilineales bacterium]
MSLASYLEAAPKAELHVHLEGSILPNILLALAKRNGVLLPTETEVGLREWFHFSDFLHFIEVYIAITRCLRDEEDYEYIAYEFGKEMARQNIRYAEVTFSPSTHHRLGIPFDIYFTGLCRGRDKARAEFGVDFNFVFDIVRNYDDASLCHELADYTTSVAIDGKDYGVIALGLGGLEAGYPAQPFAGYFKRALAAGLHSTPHSGETDGPQSIWASLGELQAERLGHGVRAIEDPELVRHLAHNKIPLEINPTSNICLRVYPSYAEHPFRRLYEAGVIVTVNSDDPPLFNTTLNQEVALLADTFHLDVDAIDEILLNGVRHSFLSAERKKSLETSFRSDLARLKKVHLNGNEAR